MHMKFDDNCYSKTTNGVTITAFPMFIDERSDQKKNFFLWAYHLFIDNNSGHCLKILSNTRNFADKKGLKYKQTAKGFEGKSYEINDKTHIEYSFKTLLSAESGVAYDSFFEAIDENGRKYKIDLPAFPLDSPLDNRTIN